VLFNYNTALVFANHSQHGKASSPLFLKFALEHEIGTYSKITITETVWQLTTLWCANCLYHNRCFTLGQKLFDIYAGTIFNVF